MMVDFASYHPHIDDIFSMRPCPPMSYKHNNLLAMRHNYWHADDSEQVALEKQSLQMILSEYGVYEQASLEDAKYLFFSLPSDIIVKGYAMGFCHQRIQSMIIHYIQQHKTRLQTKQPIKIQFRL